MDGEIVAFEGRRTSFARLQGRLSITDPEEAEALGHRGLLLRLLCLAGQ